MRRPHIIVRALKRGREKQKSQLETDAREKRSTARGQLRTRKGPGTKEWGQPLEAGRGKKIILS